MPASNPIYRITTWDMAAQQFTSQVGVPSVRVGLGGLRRALRELADAGYDIGREAPSVLVERIDQPNGVNNDG